jgi:pSer/pThr/pTyr-binding forkhead associated (FHA) protein
MTKTRTDNLSELLTINMSDQQDTEVANPFIGDLPAPDDGISFYITRISLAVIVRSGGDSFFIGRSMEGSSPVVMLNLEDLNGFAMGVSRRHAMVRVTGRAYEVIDLASRNGTWLSDQRLIPNKPYPLLDGSLLRIGQERLLVRYHFR